MKFRLLSDLHSEFWPNSPNLWPKFHYAGEDVLVLAGDIAVGASDVAEMIDYFLWLGFPHVVYTPGNHDYWGSHMHEFEDKLTEEFKDLPVTLLFGRGERVKIKDVTVFGGTLWTEFNRDPIAIQAAKDMINDYRRIKNYTVNNTIRLYEQHFANIKFLYENTSGKKLIVTHFLPGQFSVHPRYKVRADVLNSYYANRLDDWILDLQNTTWVHGHSHDSFDSVLGDTRIIANPYGYDGYETNKEFNPNKVIEI